MAVAAAEVDVFKEMVDNALQGMYVQQNYRSVYANPAWARLHGYTVAEVMAMPSLWPLFHKSEHERLRRYAVDRLAGSPAPERYRYRANHRTGKQIWLEIFVRVITWRGAKAVMATVIDVDAEERYAERLRLRQRQRSMELEVRARNQALEWSNRQLSMYAAIINQMSERISVIGTDYRYRTTNQANLDFWRRGPDQIIGHHLSETLGRCLFNDYAQEILARCFVGESLTCERALTGPHGERRDLAVTVEPFRDGDDRTIIGAIVSVRDNSQAKQTERQLRMFASVVEQVSDRISVISTDYRYRMTNRANLDYHKKPIEAFLNRHMAEIVGEQDFRANGKPQLDRCFAGESVRVRRSGIDGSGHRRMLDVLLEPYREADGTISGAVATLRDVTEAHRLSERLAYQASHDELTGLVNRRAFEQHLRAAIAATADSARSAAFCFIDLDQFKVVNDTVGHLVGDQLLQQVADLLSAKIRAGDVLARLGGDEFGLLLSGCSLRRARRAAETLVAVMNDHRFFHEGQVFEVSASIGIAAINRHTRRMCEVMSQADLACYAAKDHGRNRVHIYQKRDTFLRRRRDEMLQAGGIRAALDQDKFALFAQPIAATGRESGRPDRIEILLRMLGEDGDLITPSAFIPAAERYGLMAEIDRWVIEHTIAYLRAMPAGSGRLEVNINVSGVTLSNETLLDFVRDLLTCSEVPPGRICFEITETAAIRNLVKTRAFMQELRGWGCRFALDDFGSGLSSLNYLKRLPVDYLKIDRSFIGDIKDDHGSRAMVAAIHQMARGLGIKTVAEGVEDRSTLAVLSDLGIDFVQGYVVGRPKRLIPACLPD